MPPKMAQYSTMALTTAFILLIYFMANWIWINLVTMPEDQLILYEPTDRAKGKESPEENTVKEQEVEIDEEMNKAVDRILTDPLVNPHPFNYRLNNVNLCNATTQTSAGDQEPSHRDVFLFVYVHSAPENYVRRLLLRSTWARPALYDLPIRIAFFMGTRRRDDLVNQAVELEAAQFGDIIQSDFEDAYRNLTYKAVSALNWITHYCNRTRYVLKTDDDAYVNMRALLRHLTDLDGLRGSSRRTDTTRTVSRQPPRRLILCRFWWKMHVLRDDPKWAVSFADFPNTHYPPYCSGIAWLFSADIIRALLAVSFRVKFFWVDDVYLTGMLPDRLSKAGVNVTWAEFGHAYIRMDKMEAFDSPLWYRYVFVHLADTHYFAQMWTKMEAAAKRYPIPAVSRVIPGVIAGHT